MPPKSSYPPTEVLERSGGRGRAEAEAAARRELGHHLWQTGRRRPAVRHWREAHRLQPNNWTYKRQAWRLAHPEQGPTDVYDSDWLTDTRKIGAENYYPPLRMSAHQRAHANSEPRLPPRRTPGRLVQ